LSARAALFLRDEGFEAWALEGGLDAWIDAGYPTESRRR
jgi:rhodanese-related sulfurtransferase